MATERCWACQKQVPADGPIYRYCFECGHAWRTRLGLAWFMWRRWGDLRWLSKIPACPCCLHDF